MGWIVCLRQNQKRESKIHSTLWKQASAWDYVGPPVGIAVSGRAVLLAGGFRSQVGTLRAACPPSHTGRMPFWKSGFLNKTVVTNSTEMKKDRSRWLFMLRVEWWLHQCCSISSKTVGRPNTAKQGAEGGSFTATQLPAAGQQSPQGCRQPGLHRCLAGGAAAPSTVGRQALIGWFEFAQGSTVLGSVLCALVWLWCLRRSLHCVPEGSPVWPAAPSCSC